MTESLLFELVEELHDLITIAQFTSGVDENVAIQKGMASLKAEIEQLSEIMNDFYDNEVTA